MPSLTTPSIPHRNVDGLTLMFRDQTIYSTRPSVQNAALCAVSRSRLLRDLSRRGFNLATIQCVFCSGRGG